jgi:predicted secreted acid phosphatase
MRLPVEARGSRWSALSSTRAGVLAALICTLAGCASAPVPREPLNLDTAKAAVIRYYDSGDYGRAVAAVAAEARTWIEQRTARRAPGERLAVVFDIDETLLSNYPRIRSIGFGYIPYDWEAWIARGEAPAIKPMRGVLLTARRLGLDVFLISSREEPRERAATEANLRREGLGDYTRLIMQPTSGPRQTVGDFKTAARRALYREGYTIIANLGDQESDLRGGYAERTFKLPDPLYLIE